MFDWLVESRPDQTFREKRSNAYADLHQHPSLLRLRRPPNLHQFSDDLSLPGG